MTDRTPQRVLITGGASGLGLALAVRLTARGDHVLIGDLATERPTAIPSEAEYVQLDVRDQDHWDAAIAYAVGTWGGLDVLYNNAGVAVGGRIDVVTMEEWERVVAVNLLGVARGCRTIAATFKRQGHGHIVNVASLAGLVHSPGMTTYNATKAGVVALSETLRSELRPYGVTTSVVCPSFFRTGLAASLVDDDEMMTKAAVDLIEQAPRSADQVAARVIEGVDEGRFVILTDRDGYLTTLAKGYARPLYDIGMRVAGDRLKRSVDREGKRA